MALKIVQTYTQLGAAAGTATTTAGIALKTGYIRVSTASTGAYLEIGNNPVATVNSFHMPTQSTEILKERIARQKIAGITTGTTTVISFFENAGNPFLVNDYVAIEGASTAGINTTHTQVLSVSPSQIVINFNSTSLVGVSVGSTAIVARSIKISAMGTNATSPISIAEVQISSQA
jgi:hypothetical protein